MSDKKKAAVIGWMPFSEWMDRRDVVARVTANVKSAFFRNMLVLMSGTAVAQVITVTVAPILTRLYDPAAFGMAAAFAAIGGLVFPPTLRYEQALMLPRESKDAANLLGLAVLSSTAIALLAGVVCVGFNHQIADLLESPGLASWLWLVPFSLFFSNFSITLNSWSSRRKRFRRGSISQVARSVGAAGSQVAAGLYQPGGPALIAGGILGEVCSAAAFTGQVLHGDRQMIFGSLNVRRMWELAKEYYEFPVYNGTLNLCNSISQSVPLLLLAHFFGPAVTGAYALGVRVLQLPMNFVTISFSQVFFQKASEVCNSGGNVHAIFRKVTLGLLALVAMPTLLALLFAPPVFAFVLGAEWWTAGEYARWLVFWLAAAFVNTPALLCAQVYRKQKALFWQNLVVLAFRTGTLVIGGLYLNALQSIILFSVVGVAFNTGITLWMWFVTRSTPCPGALAPKDALTP